MKLPPFDYARPRSVAEACTFLVQPGAKILAGGQSLLVRMMTGLEQATLLVDINGVEDFPGVIMEDGVLRIGALTRHAELAAPGLAGQHVPILPLAARHVAHPAVRNRGTVCGSLANADPVAEFVACALLLNARFRLASALGTRDVPAEDFYRGMFKTSARGDELLVEVAFPVAERDRRYGFMELSTRWNDPASLGVALCASDAAVDLVFFGAGMPPLPCRGLRGDVAEAAAAALRAHLPVLGVKCRQAAALTRRLLRDLPKAPEYA